jgi:uncharacterized protein YecE (DUF72 family)
MTKFYVGTAGWSYEDWEGLVYPRPKPRGFHPLPFLARLVDTVEINITFYRTPAPAMSSSWVRRVEAFPDFLFTVKLLQAFTHERQAFTQKDVDEFKAGIAPLVAARRLAALLVQFPWSFANTPGNTDYLARLFGLFADHPLALEVRHRSWVTPEFFRFLAGHRVGFCNIDQPLFPSCIAPSAEAPHPDFAYVRMHGRNAKDWFRRDAGRDDRYNYLYARDELAEWVDRIRQLGKKSGRVFVITNNHYRGQALANALQIKNLLTGEKLDVPETLLETYPALREIVSRIRSGSRDLFQDDPPSAPDDKEEKT